MQSTIYKLLFKSIFILTTIISLYLNFSTDKVSADNFYSSGGDISNCNVAITDTVSYSNLPSRSSNPGGFNYDPNLIRGESGNYINGTRFVPNLGDMVFPNAVRYEGIGENISVPPNTNVDIGFYTYNFSGHDVHMKDIKYFTSQPNPSNGDWTKLGAPGNNGEITWNDWGETKKRTGKYFTINLNKDLLLSQGSSPIGSKVYSFQTIQPLKAHSRNISYQYNSKKELIVNFTFKLENQSKYNLNNIHIKNSLPMGKKIDFKTSISAEQTKDINYAVNYGTNYPLSMSFPQTEIYDPNQHTETTSTPNIPSMVMTRNDTTNRGWYGNQPSFPSNANRMSITLIPYTIYTGTNEIKLSPDLNISKTVSDSNEKHTKETDSKVGEEIEYEIKIHNKGARAENIQITDDYDQKYIKILDAAGGQNNGSLITWNIPHLQHNETKIFNIKAKIYTDFDQNKYTFFNKVNMKHDNKNKSDQVKTHINPKAKNEVKKYLSISDLSEQDAQSDSNEINNDQDTNESSEKAKDKQPGTERSFVESKNQQEKKRFLDANTLDEETYALQGDTITYKIIYRNSGDGNSTNTILEDHLPKHIYNNFGEKVQIISKENITAHGATITENEDYFVLSWDIGKLRPSQEFHEVYYTVNLSFLNQVEFSQNIEKRVLDNIVYLKSNEHDDIEDNAIISVNQPILTIEKIANKQEYTEDEPIIFTIKVTNSGSSPATGQLSDMLPQELDLETINIENYEKSENEINVAITVLPREEKTITLTTYLKPEIKQECIDYIHTSNVVEIIFTDEKDNPQESLKDSVEIKIDIKKKFHCNPPPTAKLNSILAPGTRNIISPISTKVSFAKSPSKAPQLVDAGIDNIYAISLLPIGLASASTIASKIFKREI